jgi:hypothetical protein
MKTWIMNHDVFISHARRDKSVADAICGKLESSGLKCWIAPRDVSAREDWTEATRKAISSSRVVVVVLSENADAASHIEREIAHAFYARRTIIPFRLAEALPRREILFYLGDVPWCNSPNPPAEEHLETLATRIQEQMPVSSGPENANPLQRERKRAALLSPSNSWFGALLASHYRTLEILKWVAIATFVCAIMLFSWFVLRQTTEWASLAESHRRTVDRGFSFSPTPLPQVRKDALEPKQTPAFTRFGLWQAADSSPTPVVQRAQHQPANPPSAKSTTATTSPQRDVIPGERAGELASEPRPRRSPQTTHRVPRDHRQQFPGTQVKEARRIADLENQRDSLRSQLKETEASAAAIQKNADRVTRERDELQARLKETEEKEQMAQKNAEIEAAELDELRAQLKEAESRALTARKNEELVRNQRDALQVRLQESEGEAQAAQKRAELVTRQLDAVQIEVAELKERAQKAETNATLAASQRDTLEAELIKREQEEPQEKTVRVDQHDAHPAASSDSAPDTQFEEDRRQPVHEDAGLAQTQPPNPGHNAKPAPLTQTLDPFVRPTQ